METHRVGFAEAIAEAIANMQLIVFIQARLFSALMISRDFNGSTTFILTEGQAASK